MNECDSTGQRDLAAMISSSSPLAAGYVAMQATDAAKCKKYPPVVTMVNPATHQCQFGSLRKRVSIMHAAEHIAMRKIIRKPDCHHFNAGHPEARIASPE